MLLQLTHLQTTNHIIIMNRKSNDREVYLLLTSFLAELEAFCTNRTAYVELINHGTEIQFVKDLPDENENADQPDESERQTVLMDMRDFSRPKILKKYYRLLLILDHVKHGKIIEHLDFLYMCFCSARCDIELVPDIGAYIRDLVNGIKTNTLKPAY